MQTIWQLHRTIGKTVRFSQAEYAVFECADNGAPAFSAEVNGEVVGHA